MGRLISKLPNEIKLKAMEYSDVPGEDDLSGAFYWGETNEGYDIWNKIYKGNYQPFYDFHKQQITPKQWCEEKGYNEYHVMIIEQYLKDTGK